MKIVRFAIIFILFGLVGTFVATFFAPDEHTADTEVVVDRPIEACWNACLNPEVMLNWMDNLDSVNTVFSSYDKSDYVAKFYFSDGERQTQTHYEVDTVIPFQMAETHIDLDEKINLKTYFEFKQIDSSKTQVNVRTTLKPDGWLFKLMLSGASDGLEDKRKNEMNAMKKWVENQATTPALQTPMP